MAKAQIQKHRTKLAEHGRVELVDGFISWKQKARYRCLEHGEIHEALPSNVAAGRGLHCCRVAAGKRCTHGMTGTPTYNSWESMKGRCTRQTDSEWENYGARGIKVCERWMSSFEAFFEDMGERPEGMTIDRIDSKGNYEPGNCKWSTIEEQNNNKRTNRIVRFKGQPLTLAQAARASGIPVGTLTQRLYTGWSEERMFMAADGRMVKS